MLGRSTLAVVGMVLLAQACAAQQTPPPAGVDDATLAARIAALDEEDQVRLARYMQAVEARASTLNVQVIWVDPPDGEMLREGARLRRLLLDEPATD